MPKISVITPVYNSERYLHQCVDSIIGQTFNDIEIILVDDGSTDSSANICDMYALHDSRIKVIHNKNSGMGVSYNLGIKAAKGDYIGFIESDDFADPKMFEALYNLAEQHNKPDIVKSSWWQYYSKSKTANKDTTLDEYKSDKIVNIKNDPWILTKQFTVWSAIYKRDFLINNNIKYLETPGASYQDVGFTYKAFCKASNIIITPDAYIYYRQDNENSSVNSKEKSEVIFNEYAEVDLFFEDNPDIKQLANEQKLIKQFYDYNWNYYRVAEYLKHDFIKHFARDFKKYRDSGELTPFFYSNINAQFLNNIMNLV